MTPLEVCKLSAEALGKNAHNNYERAYALPVEALWSPFTNAEQRWECVEWLLLHECSFSFGTDDRHYLTDGENGIVFVCPAAEFPARAVAEIQRRKE